MSSLSIDIRAPLASDRPKCNSILHLFGEWLFKAAFINSKERPLKLSRKYWILTQKISKNMPTSHTETFLSFFFLFKNPTAPRNVHPQFLLKVPAYCMKVWIPPLYWTSTTMSLVARKQLEPCAGYFAPKKPRKKFCQFTWLGFIKPQITDSR